MSRAEVLLHLLGISLFTGAFAILDAITQDTWEHFWLSWAAVILVILGGAAGQASNEIRRR